MSVFLEARNVTKVFGDPRLGTGTVALDDFSYQIDEEAPSITAVAGESGSGKSTLARLLLGFVQPTEGQVLYRGKDLRHLSGQERKRYRREVQAVFQDPFGVYNPFYKVDHILTVPVKNFGLASSRAEGRRLIERSLETVGLDPGEILGRFPHQLSGGQRQRVTVARALLLKPRLIIADEPVSMVDASLRATILDSLLTLYRDFGISFVYITHDLATAYQISERLFVLYQGTIAEAGPVRRVIECPQHPYTQLLIRSIPSPDPDQRWEGELVAEADDPIEETVASGCKFAPRCPHVMPMCRDAPPPLFHTEGVAATCYLHREAPVIPSGEIMKVLPEAGSSSRERAPISRTA